MNLKLKIQFKYIVKTHPYRIKKITITSMYKI